MSVWPVIPNYIVSQGQGFYLPCPLTLASTDQCSAHWVIEQIVGLVGSQLKFITCCVTSNKLHNLSGFSHLIYKIRTMIVLLHRVIDLAVSWIQ